MTKRVLLISFCAFLLSALPAQQKVGIVLSGGGALGLAHIGVLQAFEENGIAFDCVAGASMGALVGAFYAAGYKPMEILEMVEKERLHKTSHLISSSHRSSHTGLYSQNTLRKLLDKYIPYDSFDSLPKRFYLSVTNLTSSESNIVGSGGHLHDYLIATASVPGIYEAVIINGNQYVDGGVLNNMPAQPLAEEEHCSVVVGADVLPHLQKSAPLKKITETTLVSLRVMQQGNSKRGIALCNHLIVSKAIEQYSEFDFKNYKEIYQIGYEAAKQYIAAHPELLKLKR